MNKDSGIGRRSFLAGAAGAFGAVVAGSVTGGVRPAAAATGKERPKQVDLALTHARVVDTVRGRICPDTTVLLAGDRIVGMGPTATVAVAAEATVVDLRGKYLIPGLWDSHVHTSYDTIDFPLHIANGVTAVREMWGHPWVHEWQQQIDSGARIGPRYVIGSAIFDGDPSLWNDPAMRPSAPIIPATPQEARAAVRSEIGLGAKFIKVYSRLAPEILQAIADECARNGIPFGGHCPDSISVEDASAMGMWTFEHLDGLWWSTTSKQAQIQRGLRQVGIDPGDAYDSWFQQIGALEWTAATSYDRRRADQLFRRLRGSHSWQVPTLILNERVDMPGDGNDWRMKFVPAGDAEFWKQWTDAISATRTPAQVGQHKILFQLRKRLVAAMAEADLPILAGTDTGTTYMYAGFSLHDELALLAESGLSATRALQSATWEPARALGLTRTTGSIAVGKVADLVALDANPLADIRNTQRIHAVVTRGQLIDADRRKQLFDEAHRAANPPDGTQVVARVSPGCACRAHAAH